MTKRSWQHVRMRDFKMKLKWKEAVIMNPTDSFIFSVNSRLFDFFLFKKQ